MYIAVENIVNVRVGAVCAVGGNHNSILLLLLLQGRNKTGELQIMEYYFKLLIT